MSKEFIKGFIYKSANLVALYVAAIAFELMLIVDFFKGGDENG